MEALCRLESVQRRYTHHGQVLNVLDDVHLAIAKNERVAITGPSGAGKSTLLSILGLIDEAFDGKYHFDGRDVVAASALDRTRWRLAKIGFAFQDLHLVPSLSATENLALPQVALGADEPSARSRAGSLLAACGMAPRANHLPGELSGGEARRVALARALVNRPRLLLVDEPTAELDGRSREGVIALLDHAWKEGAAIVAVTHDPELLGAFPRRLDMDHGKIVKDEKK